MKEDFKNKIDEVMSTALHNIRSLVDVDIVIGQPINSASELIIIPLTKVSLGFVAGGGEYYSELKEIRKETEYPFAGGSGAGISLQPIGFLVVNGKDVELIKIDSKSAIEKLIEAVPEVAKFIAKNFGGNKKDEKKSEN